MHKKRGRNKVAMKRNFYYIQDVDGQSMLRPCDLYDRCESRMRPTHMEYLFPKHMWVLTLRSVSQLSFRSDISQVHAKLL